jgi:hypothetical protein
MNLTTIQLKLESYHYYTQVVTHTLIVGSHSEEAPDPHGIAVFKAFCSVEIQDNIIVIEYGQSNLSMEETFADEAKAVDFITRMFPI